MRAIPVLLASAVLIVAGSAISCNRSKAVKPAASVPNGALQGKVLEVLPASPYNYLRLQAAQGEVWAAVPAGAFKVGDSVTVMVQLKMDKFQSASLNRTFDTVYFATLAPAPGTAPAAPAGMGMAPAAGPAPAPDVKVGKASGANAHAINELYAQRDALKEKTIVVKGRIVKYNEGILGRTWIHLRDGSGSAQGRDNDLAVTTKDTAKMGDIVTIKGTLRMNKDVGSGYTYPVIIEDARIIR